MSYIHKVVNVLLRGLVIYAVLGLECTYSNDLPNHSSDAANVATTGKRSPCRIQVSPIYFTHVLCYPPPLSSSPSCSQWLSRGKPRKALRAGREGEREWGGLYWKVMHFNVDRHLFFPLTSLCMLLRNAWHDRNAGCILAEDKSVYCNGAQCHQGCWLKSAELPLSLPDTDLERINASLLT